MNQTKPQVAVFITGGTILCQFDQESGQIAPALTGAQLLEAAPGLGRNFRLKHVEFCRIPGPHFTPETCLSLAEAVGQMLDREDIAGAVVVQGTDSLEETAYLLDLLLDSPKSVVFTGAMKSGDEPYADAVGNLAGAVRAAAEPALRGSGVMVFFNQTLIPARFVTKTDANRIDAFQARDAGPMGSMQGDTLHLFYSLDRVQYPKITRLESRVELIKITCGMSPLLLDCCVQNKVDGIVIEGMGAGNLSPTLVPGIKRALDQGIAVVMTTRCPKGFATPSYAYEGGGACLEQMGVCFAKNLSGPKARLKLMVLLSAGLRELDWKKYF